MALLALTLVQPHRCTQCSLVSGVLNVVAAVFTVALSLLAHYKSHRPSILLCSYLFLSVLSNVARCQELWFATEESNDVTFAAVYTVLIVVQLLFLGTNSKWRMSWLGWEAKDHSPEETSSIFSLALFSWLNSLLLRGYRGVLSVDDLYPLDPAIATQVPGAEACQLPIVSEAGNGSWAVLKWSFKPVLGPVLLPVLPRLCLVGFSFCQPFFIRSLLSFVTEGENGGEAPTSAAGLVGASILINVGIAVSTSLYWYYQERAQSIMRGYLVSSIYRKTSELQATGDMAAVTLMSTDVDRIYMGLRFVHEVWASVLQVGVACWLLQRELGLVFLALLILAALGFATSFGMSKYAVRYQRDWMKYIQKRIGVTSKVLSHVKDYRISGLIGPITDLVQNERVVEIHHGGKSRFIIAIAGAVSQIPFAFAPLIAFVFGPRRMDSTLAFTVLSYLSLLTTPLKLVIQILPVLISCMACLERIHTFVSAPPKKDHRLPKQGADVGKFINGTLMVRDGQFGWADKLPVVKGINMSVDTGSLTFITGPVASGKTTLLKALLGEVPYSEGEVIFGFDAQKVSYCDQAPFLMNASVKKNIIGFSPFNTGRYRAVLHATLLLEDLNSLPQGDRTKVGSKGVSLSGGQRQRISLARALYHDADILVLDDIFTGLDAETQEKVCRRVFGRDGLLRSRAATVILATQASQFAHVADQILELSTEDIVAKHTKMTASTAAQNQSDIQDSSSKSSDLDISADNGYDMPEKLYVEESPDGEQEKIAEQKKATTAALTTDRTVYWHYMTSIGVVPLLAYAFCTTGMGFATNFPTVWLKIWSDDSLKGYQYNPFAFYMGIFGLLAGLTVFFLFVGGFISLRIFVRLSGTNLHKAALETAVHSSLRFLTTTDTGTVLNLFSQDMTIIDSQLPQMTNNLVFNIASALVQAVIIAISSAYLAISYPFFIVILYVVQRFYLPTSKQLRILDLEAKSPL
jgi:ABC-type multidrug transport system fused ATPase/permease subunit